MLELKDVCFTIRKDGEDANLVDKVSIQIPKGHFMAIVGPSGCGKTTLLKTIAGLNPESDGALIWDGRDLSKEGDFSPSEIGYVPQFSIAYDPLTVDESVEAATRLRVKTKNNAELDQRIDRVLEETGLAPIADRPVKVLSGGQKRRLGLAMELVSDPKLLLCDEVTSGLDPRSEREIVRLLHDLSRKDGRIVLSVTHSLAHLELYDSILVLHEGRVAYHGPPDQLTHYFSVKDTEEVYPRLAGQPSDRWQSSWEKHRVSYYKMLERNREKSVASGALSLPPAKVEGEEVKDEVATKMPGLVSQFGTLLSRRWRIFFRDRGQVLLQLAIMICFPLLVILFSDKAKDPIRKYSDTRQSDMQEEVQEHQNVRMDQVKVGSAVSGIIMFQVVLLALMGSNNSAREIAGERLIYEKEKFGGLRPSAYLASKVAFLSCLVIAQSLWMAFFVNTFGQFRGDFVQHAGFLLLVNGAMTAICLAISSLMRTAEQASLLSIYLVGFQLPLSGAVLALPESVETYTRPFISSYWAWSGSVEGLQTQVHDAVKAVIDTTLSSRDACLYTLAAHIGVALFASWLGTRRHQWD
ncbi:ATP-binding cassette domain-containing protein [Luteolibacter ambystomatis]|uniref:ATP-binding cassette domain-containing protein n=1 Tax=Luteolibacter ambystomatis TaxID=2824561 RepID=A0A975G9A8_9BACT|nr:ATP-binding cassette domain-containing protein [Luteolibacter ambystomatis]QUE51217.1 ATP-binding cassette domain-containing protein [Luteolibacter ambystomatis]